MPTYSTPPQVKSKAIAWNTASIGTAVKVCDLAAGDLVTKVWLEVDTAWNSVTSDTGTVSVADEDASGPQPIATFNMQTAAGISAGDVELSNAPATLGASVGRAVGAAEVFVKVVSVGGSLSAGAGTVYCLVESADAAGAAYAVPAIVDGTAGTGGTAGHVA